MLHKVQFTINSKIEISYNDQFYKSNIEDMGDNFISISIPIKDGQYIPLRRGESVEAIYYYDKDIYKFYTIVIDRIKDKIPIIRLIYPKEVFKIQRRQFVRVPIVCSIVYSKLVHKNSTINYDESPKKFKAVITDLSGGGMRIKLKEEVKAGDILLCHIPIGDSEAAVKGRVLRVEKDLGNKLNICGVSFIDLEEKTREGIIKFIFQIMRKQMKKGLKK